ncbi:MAG: histidinol dehydrogenase [Acidiferrobacteraceae bacterium]
MPVIRRLDTRSAGFWPQLDQLLGRRADQSDDVESRVRAIIADVRREGDEALLRYTREYDRMDLKDAAALEIDPQRLSRALAALGDRERGALEEAARRIRAYHEHQRQESWEYEDSHGVRLGQRITPLDRVGIYVPGGKASYPSSVLMNALPASIAGVGEIVMAVPTPDGTENGIVLAAAALAGVTRVFRIGGAQAVAALAFGTATVPRVDKIVGPGNVYVATAKRLVFGQVAIDMIAGPSEIVVVCDGLTDPDWVAMDLFSQAEHDERAQSILISPDPAFLDAVEQAMGRALMGMERAAVIASALESAGALILVRSLEEAAEVVNEIAPEHLELSVADPRVLAAKVRHAGAIFLGRHTAEAIGDYCAGPNHVLPTSGTARFSSPLGVYDFQKRTSIIACSPEGAARLGVAASILARAEGLTAHARSAECRMSDGKSRQQS